MASIDDYRSSSNVYNFSKGPKSIYHAWGDDDLPGAVLNVPQTDEDDEWGGTERISLERTYDRIGDIYKTLFDPYTQDTEITLEPGTIFNVAKRVARLTGNSYTALSYDGTGIFDLSVPSMTLGEVIIHGVDNKILIGSGFEASESSITLNDNVELSGAVDTSILKYKTNSIKFTENGTDPAYIEIIVCGKAFKFKSDAFELPSGASISAANAVFTGKITSRDIEPSSNALYDIGTTDLRYKKIYGLDADFSAGLKTPKICGNTDLTINANTTYIKSLNDVTTYLSVSDTGIISYKDIIPDSNNTRDIGTDTLRFKKIYAVDADFTNATISNLKTPMICGNTNLTTNADYTYIKSLSGATTYMTVSNTDGIKAHIGIIPDSNDTIDIGLISLRFKTIYAVGIDATSATITDIYTSGIHGGTPTVCGAVTIDGSPINLKVFGNDALIISSASIGVYKDVLPQGTIDLGSDTYKYTNIYGNTGYFDTMLVSGGVCGSLFSYDVGEAHVRGATVKLSSTSSDFNILLQDSAILPSPNKEVSLGGPFYVFKELWMRDYSTTLARRISVCAGAIYIE